MQSLPASSSKPDVLASSAIAGPRRRSVDVGGLALALNSDERPRGSGWGDWSEDSIGTPDFAELLTAMYTQSQTLVNTKLKEIPPSIVISPEDRTALINSLDDWTFEPHKLTSNDCLACVLLIFDSLYHIEGFNEEIGIDLVRQVCPFLRHLRSIYRQQNAYHNFEHAVDVLQAMHRYLALAEIVPPVTILNTPDVTWKRSARCGPPRLIDSLTNGDLFALYVAAVGHDVGHPGFTNNFMKNAHAPLSKVYDDKSALEQMHCSLLIQIMRHHGLGVLVDPQRTSAQPESSSASNGGTAHAHPHFRQLLLGTVLATDMVVHDAFMQQFQDLVIRFDAAPHLGATPAEKLLLGQALLKCADISNPSRPPHISGHWATVLMSEWHSQDQLERHLCLPCSTPAKDGGADDPVNECNVQIGFIKRFVKPLLEVTVSSIPELDPLLMQCKANLAMWEARSAALIQSQLISSKAKAQSIKTSYMDSGAGLFQLGSPFEPHGFLNVFSLSLPENLRTPTPSATVSPHEMRSSAGTTPVSGNFPNMPPPDSRTAGRRPDREQVSSASLRSRSRSLSPELQMPGAYPLPRLLPHDPSTTLRHHQTHHSVSSASSTSTPLMSPSTFSGATISPTTISSPASSVATGIGALSNAALMHYSDKSTERMRAAYSASVRKKPSRVLNRSSWNPPYVGVMPPLPASAPAPLSDPTTPQPNGCSSNHSSPSIVTTSGSGSLTDNISPRLAGLDMPRSLSLFIPPSTSNAAQITTK